MPCGVFCFEDIHFTTPGGIVIRAELDVNRVSGAVGDSWIIRPEHPELEGSLFLEAAPWREFAKRYRQVVFLIADRVLVCHPGDAAVLREGVRDAVRTNWDGQSLGSLENEFVRWGIAEFLASLADVTGVGRFRRSDGRRICFRQYLHHGHS